MIVIFKKANVKFIVVRYHILGSSKIFYKVGVGRYQPANRKHTIHPWLDPATVLYGKSSGKLRKAHTGEIRREAMVTDPSML